VAARPPRSNRTTVTERQTEDPEMALTLILELPTATGATYASRPEDRFTALELDHQIHVIPLTTQIAPSPVADSEEAEPTWEDAAWQ
jgi:hypothetical protein